MWPAVDDDGSSAAERLLFVQHFTEKLDKYLGIGRQRFVWPRLVMVVKHGAFFISWLVDVSSLPHIINKSMSATQPTLEWL